MSEFIDSAPEESPRNYKVPIDLDFYRHIRNVLPDGGHVATVIDAYDVYDCVWHYGKLREGMELVLDVDGFGRYTFNIAYLKKEEKGVWHMLVSAWLIAWSGSISPNLSSINVGDFIGIDFYFVIQNTFSVKANTYFSNITEIYALEGIPQRKYLKTQPTLHIGTSRKKKKYGK